MKRQLRLAVFLFGLLLASFVGKNTTWAQWITKSVGTPKCEQFNDPEKGWKCFTLWCSTAPDSFANYTSCTPGSITASGFSKCEIVPSCGKLDRAIACSTNPPKITYAYTGCDDIQREEIRGINCPLECRKCQTPPSVYGTCPDGYYKSIDNCCIPQNLAGGGCTLADRAACTAANGLWDWDTCQCTLKPPSSPILVDTLGNGFDL
ncbi:MAG TPA: hypothetical protein VGX92_01850, partial [Pyrinomonadaceae bacterium]|nr:hypothetical protein [Pyrinomonadaceae bacterium]